MGIFIKIQNTKTKKITSLGIQEYSIGLYVIENNHPARQYVLDCTQDEFLESLRNTPEFEIIEQ